MWSILTALASMVVKFLILAAAALAGIFAGRGLWLWNQKRKQAKSLQQAKPASATDAVADAQE